ncbi:unnamed protein product [Chrysoparadoxa australica]
MKAFGPLMEGQGTSGTSNSVLGNIESNPFFTGGLGLAVLGAAAGFARQGAGLAMMMARRHLIMTLEVTSKDQSYPWVLNWLSLEGRKSQHLSVNTAITKTSDGSMGHRFDMMPGPGKHLIIFRGKWFWVERERQVNSVSLESGTPWEKVLLTSIGRDVSVFDSLLHEARSRALKKFEGDDSITIYTCWGTEWRPFGHPRRKRQLSSVVLDDGISERIVKDLDEWRRSAHWYHDRGVPYRRGYLLHGPPGSGKTSFIYALAGKGYLGYDISILSLGEEGITDDRLAIALSCVPQRSLVLLEDVDAAFVHRHASRDSRGRVTFSGLLNTLDGVASSEERIVFMTTNFVERLDPALIRPGRVDVVELLDDASDSQAKRLFAQFYPDLPDDSPLPATFAHVLRERQVKHCYPCLFMASLQGFLLNYKAHPEEAAEGVVQFAQDERRAKDHASTQGDVEESQPTRRQGRRISAWEVDRMCFNPQKGSGFER